MSILTTPIQSRTETIGTLIIKTQHLLDENRRGTLLLTPEQKERAEDALNLYREISQNK